MSRLPPLDLGDPLLASKLQGQSLAIAASAGSGKTFTLVTLVLGFLGVEGNRAFEVLATTFGRESASDLKARILGPLDTLALWNLEGWNQAVAALHAGWGPWDALINSLGAPGEIALAARQWRNGDGWAAWTHSGRAAKEHWVRARREAEGLEVGTVHGVALEVLRRGGETGNGVVEAADPRLQALLRRAGRESLALPPGHVDHLPARRLLAWMEGMEAKKPRWELLCEAFDAHTDALGSWREDTKTEETAQAFWNETRAWIEAYRPFGEAPSLAAKLTAKEKPHANFAKFGLPKLVAAPASGASEDTLLRFTETLAGSLPSKDGALPENYYSTEFIEAMAPLGEALPDLVEHWLSLLLERVFTRFEALKNERGFLSYGDLVRRALGALETHPWEPSPKLLLVDEFQDINPVQDAFLDALHAGSMVVVGDRKQAIYGFRGGLSSLLENRISHASAEGHAFRLPRNHRSTEPVVKVANTFVRDVMPLLDADAADPDGEQEDMGIGVGEPLVALARVDSQKPKGSDLPATAAWVAALSGEGGWQGLGMTGVPNTGARRRTLLLPQRTGLSALRRLLQKHGIEPLVVSQDGFWDSPGVRLMMALLESVACPLRAIPFLAVMRSAWIGAGDAELRELAPALDKGWLEGDVATAPPHIQEGMGWLRGLRGASAQAILAAGVVRPGLLETLAASAVHGRLEPERARRNLEAFMGCIPGLSSDAAAAFAELDTLRARPKGDALAEASGADLLIQTVHAAKGLEYEDVILPMLNYPVKGTRKGEVGRRGAQRHLLLGWRLGRFRASGLRSLSHAEDRRVLREGLNLLYVALTRARHRLVLLHQWGPSKENEGACIQPASASARLENRKKAEWPHVASELAARIPNLPQFNEPPALSPLVLKPPADPREGPLHPREAHLLGGRPEDPEAEERQARRRQGTALHGLIREALIRHAVDPALVEAHLAASPISFRWPSSVEKVRGFLSALKARNWEKLPRRTEFPLPHATVRGGLGYADLVIWESDRVNPVRVHIVDFKLRVDRDGPEMEMYRLQLQTYRQALLHQHPHAEVDAWLYSLDRGEWVEV